MSLQFLVNIFVETMALWTHTEIYWPLYNITIFAKNYSFLSNSKGTKEVPKLKVSLFQNLKKYCFLIGHIQILIEFYTLHWHSQKKIGTSLLLTIKKKELFCSIKGTNVMIWFAYWCNIMYVTAAAYFLRYQQKKV